MGPCSLSGVVQTLRVQKTLSAEDTPVLYREPGLVTGFRKEHMPWFYYLVSVFQIHNETINIWSHLVGFGLIVRTLYLYSVEVSLDHHWPVILSYGLCCLIYTFLSTFAHTFHSKSELIHYTCFQLDYVGIGFYTLGFAIVTCYCSCHHHYYPMLERYFLPGNVVMSWLGFVCSSTSKLRYRRPYPFQRKMWNICSFGLQISAVFFLVLVRYWDCWHDDRCVMSSMNHHTCVAVLTMVSVLFFSCHLPEKAYPGKFDIVGHGHQIFHVLCTAATLLEFEAAFIDVDSHSHKLQGHEPDPYSLYTALLVYGTLSLVTVFLLQPYTKHRIQQDVRKSY